MAYGDFKFLTRGTAYDKILRDKAFNIAKNLALMVFTFLIKKLLAVVSKMKTSQNSN